MCTPKQKAENMHRNYFGSKKHLLFPSLSAAGHVMRTERKATPHEMMAVRGCGGRQVCC